MNDATTWTLNPTLYIWLISLSLTHKIPRNVKYPMWIPLICYAHGSIGIRMCQQRIRRHFPCLLKKVISLFLLFFSYMFSSSIFYLLSLFPFGVKFNIKLTKRYYRTFNLGCYVCLFMKAYIPKALWDWTYFL